MKPNFCLLRTSTIYFFIWLVRSTFTTPGQPLLFDPFTRQVYSIESDSPDTSPKFPLAVACPARDQYERALNRDQSFDHKALFVRMYYDQKEATAIEIQKCEARIQLAAVLYHQFTMDDIEFGYEIYAEGLPTYSYKSKYLNYGPVAEASSAKKFLLSAFTQKDNPTLGKDKVRFIWISKISTKYRVRIWNIIQIRYEIFRNAYQVNVTCDDYDLAKTLYRKGTLDDYYSPDNQKKIFSSVKLPKPVGDNASDSTYAYVKKYYLLLPYNFQASSSSIVSCSDLTTIPIWYPETETLLNYVEHFLIAIGQITKNPLLILSGVHDVVTLLSTTGKKPKPVPMYLDSKKKRIPIPRIIYKIITYRTYKCVTKQELCLFEVIIMIHNHPNITQKDKLCLEDKCEDWGWDNIQYMDTARKGEKSQNIYCCEFDKNIKKILDYKEKKQRIGYLNLKEFPHYEEAIKKHEHTDKHKDFEKQMDELVVQSRFFKNRNQKSTGD